MLQTLNSGALQKSFNARLASVGRSAYDFADVNHAHLIFAWGIVNDRAVDYPLILNGMRRRMFTAITSQQFRLPPVGTDAEKQYQTEIIAVLTELVLQTWRNSTDPDRAILQAGIAAWGKQAGINYRALNLTENGFAARR